MKTYMVTFAAFLTILSFSHCDNASTNDEDANASETDAPSKEVSDKQVMELGKSIAGDAFQQLSGALKEAMADGGPTNAISVCNVKALPLTQAVAQKYNATVNRTALRIRNPENAPSAEEIEILNSFQQQAENGSDLKPTIRRPDNGPITFYAPILLKSQCVVCHGQPGMEVQKGTLDELAELYPQDQATGFAEGDLRGMWVIAFPDRTVFDSLR